jgi:short-subunit dehydrogenase
MPRALITGATAGLGLVFAQRLGADGHDLVLVARDRSRLEQTAADLTAAHGVGTEVLVADLDDDEQLRLVEKRLADADPDRAVDLLVNNAGFAVNHRFLDGDVEDEDRMLRVLVRAVLRLTRAALPGMRERGHGAVVNVSSVAGFVPQGTYSAAKSWVTAFTQGLTGDLAGTGVRVLALCPGYTHTEFHERAGIDKKAVPAWMWLDADRVVDDALTDLRRGRTVSVPSKRYKAIVALSRLVPVAALTTVANRSRGIRGR